MTSLSVWITAARPKTLAAGACPVILGTALAANVDPTIFFYFIPILLGALMLQIGSNFVNDYCDFKNGADTDERKGPLRVMQASLVTPQAMRKAIFLIFFSAALISLLLIYRGGYPIVIILITSLLAAYFYTGGSRPLGYLGLGDIMVFVFFGPIAVCGTYYLYTLTFTLNVLLISLGPGFLSTAILAINNLRDYETDRTVNKMTLPARFGPLFGKIEYTLCLLLPYLTPLPIALSTKNYYSACLILITIPTALKLIKTVFYYEDNVELNPVLYQTAKLLVFYTFILSVSQIL